MDSLTFSFLEHSYSVRFAALYQLNFYFQVVRAKERIDEELASKGGTKPKDSAATSSSSSPESSGSSNTENR